MRSNRCIRMFCMITVMVPLFVCEALGYEKDTHFALDRIILHGAIQGYRLDAFLKTYLGLDDGIMSLVEYAGCSSLFKDEEDKGDDGNPYVWRWIASGGVYEDESFQRCLRHFHDPLKPWDAAGYAGAYESAILWAQDSNRTSGQYAWDNVRDYYYKALTKGGQERQYYLGETFRGVGQLMHLVQDASVPAHARDDGHILYNFEQFILRTTIYNRGVFESWVRDSSQYTYDKAVLEIPMTEPLVPLAPIARLVDTDRYTREDLNPEVTVGQPIGLAEYTNANYFSEDTIFDSAYPFPDYDSVEVAYWGIENPRNPEETTERAYYYRKIGHGDAGYALATVPCPVEAYDLSLEFGPVLDDFVYNVYAERLIPRAVSYSHGLLEFFFRGTIAIDYKSGDSLSSSNRLRIVAENSTMGDESMNDGSIELVVSYKVSPDSEYRSMVLPELNGVRAIPRGSQVELAFDVSGLPDSFYSGFVYVVYRGRLGLENGAVAVGYQKLYPGTWGWTNDFGTWLYSGSYGGRPRITIDDAGISIREMDYAHEWGQTLVYRVFTPDVTGIYRLSVIFEHNGCCNGVGLTTNPRVDRDGPGYEFKDWLNNIYLPSSGAVTYYLEQGTIYYLGIYFYEGSSETDTNYYMHVYSWNIERQTV